MAIKRNDLQQTVNFIGITIKTIASEYSFKFKDLDTQTDKHAFITNNQGNLQ